MEISCFDSTESNRSFQQRLARELAGPGTDVHITRYRGRLSRNAAGVASQSCLGEQVGTRPVRSETTFPQQRATQGDRAGAALSAEDEFHPAGRRAVLAEVTPFPCTREWAAGKAGIGSGAGREMEHVPQAGGR